MNATINSLCSENVGRRKLMIETNILIGEDYERALMLDANKRRTQ